MIRQDPVEGGQRSKGPPGPNKKIFENIKECLGLSYLTSAIQHTCSKGATVLTLDHFYTILLSMKSLYFAVQRIRNSTAELLKFVAMVFGSQKHLYEKERLLEVI